MVSIFSAGNFSIPSEASSQRKEEEKWKKERERVEEKKEEREREREVDRGRKGVQFKHNDISVNLECVIRQSKASWTRECSNSKTFEI